MQKQTAEELDEWQHKAMRTLAFAYKKVETSIMRTSRTSTAEVVALLDANDLQLQAIAAIADPIRPDVPAAVQECRHAGIEVKVVTGDTAATALEIGKQIGVFEDEPENIGADGSLTSLDQQMITGEEWEALSDDEAYERAKDIRVMSRARPTDKQRLVAMLQKRGEVVAHIHHALFPSHRVLYTNLYGINSCSRNQLSEICRRVIGWMMPMALMLSASSRSASSSNSRRGWFGFASI